MTRVKRSNVARKRRKKTLKITKGFRGSLSTLFRSANTQKMKSLKYSYKDRNVKKRKFRSIWITRINAAAKLQNLKYSEFIYKLKKLNIFLNRKILSQLLIRDYSAIFQLITN